MFIENTCLFHKSFILLKIALFHLLDSYKTSEKISKNPHKER